MVKRGEEMPVHMPQQSPRFHLTRIYLGWVAPGPPGRTLSQWLAKDPETNLITIKPEPVSHASEPFPWAPLPCCSLPGRPLLIKSPALSARVSPRTIHFWALDRSPLLGLGSGPPPSNTITDHGWSKSNHSSSPMSGTDFFIKTSFIYLDLGYSSSWVYVLPPQWEHMFLKDSY